MITKHKAQTFILALVMLALVVHPVGAAKPDTYLGKFQPGDTIAFTWQIDTPNSPLWATYRINDDNSYTGMLRCYGCFEQTAPGEWSSNVVEYNTGRYMICANVAGDLQTFRTWTFRIGGNGNKPIKADGNLTECP